MLELTKRSELNPILTPKELTPLLPGAEIECLLNPGAFLFEGKTHLVLRVAERMPQEQGFISTLIQDTQAPQGIRMFKVALDDPELHYDDSRLFSYRGKTYLTTFSYLLDVSSADGLHFDLDQATPILGNTPLETFGLEDCRVTPIGQQYALTFTAVSENGPAVGMKTTSDWKNFSQTQVIFPPPNKDCTLFPEKINGNYYAMHRPIVTEWNALNIWLAESPDLIHWGNHHCLMTNREGMWDSQRIGAGCAPIKTEMGWLEIYHGCDETSRYCLGAFLLDLNDPSQVIARSEKPIMEPTTPYETNGFFSDVIFTNGQIVDGDTIRMYYGAADSVICMATLSIRDVLNSLA